MTHAQIIARAWLDEDFRASLAAKGIDVPDRPADLSDDQLDILSDVRELLTPAAPSSCCCT
jgi:hypothetical protein